MASESHDVEISRSTTRLPVYRPWPNAGLPGGAVRRPEQPSPRPKASPPGYVCEPTPPARRWGGDSRPVTVVSFLSCRVHYLSRFARKSARRARPCGGPPIHLHTPVSRSLIAPTMHHAHHYNMPRLRRLRQQRKSRDNRIHNPIRDLHTAELFRYVTPNPIQNQPAGIRQRIMELTRAFHECAPGRRKLAVKVVDIFASDTMIIVEVRI